MNRAFAKENSHLLSEVLGANNKSSKATALMLLRDQPQQATDLHKLFTQHYSGTRLGSFVPSMSSRLYLSAVKFGFAHSEAIGSGWKKDALISITPKGEQLGKVGAASVLQFEYANKTSLSEVLGPLSYIYNGLTTPYVRLLLLLELCDSPKGITTTELARNLQLDRAVVAQALQRFNQLEVTSDHATLSDKGLLVIEQFALPLLHALADTETSANQELVSKVEQGLPEMAKTTGELLAPSTIAVKNETREDTLTQLLRLLPTDPSQGRTYSELAMVLHLSNQTVRSYVERLRKRGRVGVILSKGTTLVYKS